MQLRKKKELERTFQEPKDSDRKFVIPPLVNYHGFTPPWVVKPRNDYEAVFHIIERATQVHPSFLVTKAWENDPSDTKRAYDLKQYLDQQVNDKAAYLAWLEAFTLNDGLSSVKQTSILDPYYPKQRVCVKEQWYAAGTVRPVRFFVPGSVENVHVSGHSCLPASRVEKKKVDGRDGAIIKGVKKQKVNNINATFLEEGDFWGPHSSDQYPPKTRLKVEEAREASRKHRESLDNKRHHIKMVEKGSYKGKSWHQTTMSSQRMAQGTEQFVRPPSLSELWQDHKKKVDSCELVKVKYQYKSCVHSVSYSGVTYKVTDSLIWNIRDGGQLGRTVLDTEDGELGNVSTLTDIVTPTVAANNEDLSLYATPISILELANEDTPLASGLNDTVPAEVTPLRMVKAVEDSVGFRLVTEETISSSPAAKLYTHPADEFVGPPTLIQFPWSGSRHYKLSKSYVLKDEERRWSYSAWEDSDRTRYLSWLEDHEVHNDLKRDAFGFRQGRLLLEAICGASVQGYGSMYGFLDSDERRYDKWFSIYGDKAIARSRACIHERKRVGGYLGPLQADIEVVQGPFVPKDLGKVGLIMDYVALHDLPAISEAELEDWFKSVEEHFKGAVIETLYHSFLARRKDEAIITRIVLDKPQQWNPELWEGAPKNLVEYYQRKSGFYTSSNISDVLQKVAPTPAVKSVDPPIQIIAEIDPELYQDMTDLFRARHTYKTPSIMDKIVSVLKRKE